MFFPRSGNRSSASYAESVVFFQRGSAVFTIEHISFSFPVFLSSIVFKYFSFQYCFQVFFFPVLFSSIFLSGQLSKVTAILIIIPFFSSEKQSKNRVCLPVCLQGSAGLPPGLRELRGLQSSDYVPAGLRRPASGTAVTAGLRLCVCGTQALCRRSFGTSPAGRCAPASGRFFSPDDLQRSGPVLLSYLRKNTFGDFSEEDLEGRQILYMIGFARECPGKFFMQNYRDYLL